MALDDNMPSSARQATSVLATTRPMPGMEVRISCRRASAGASAINRSISASGCAPCRSTGLQELFDAGDQDPALGGTEPVLERSLLGDGGPAREHQLLQLGDKCGRRRVGGELEAFAHDGECARIDRIGLCELADLFRQTTRTPPIYAP